MIKLLNHLLWCSIFNRNSIDWWEYSCEPLAKGGPIYRKKCKNCGIVIDRTKEAIKNAERIRRNFDNPKR